MSKRKKTYEWFGGGENLDVKTDASTSVADLIQMIPGRALADDAGVRTQFLIEAIYLHMHVHRLLITEVDALGFIVYQGNLSDSGNNPVQALDAVSLQNRLYSRKQIMMMGPLAVPPIIFDGVSAFTTQEEVLVSSHEYQANRKHDRSQQVLTLAVNADVSDVISCFCQWRVLVSW